MVEADASLPRHMTPARTSSRWRRAWQWVVATRARRGALTLATLAGMAAPFVPVPDGFDGTASYEVTFNFTRDIKLAAKDRAEIVARWGDGTDISGCFIYSKPKYEFDYDYRRCVRDRTALKNGYREGEDEYMSLLTYVAFNGAVMLATLVVTFFALTAGMAAVRKWWRWLW